MTILYLTRHEQELFSALPESVREGWTIETESTVYADTPAHLELRLALARIHDPKLVALREVVQKAATVQEVADAIAATDLGSVDNDDVASLFFALGPSYLSQLIAHLLPSVIKDKDVEGVTALTVIRHSILQAFQFASSR